MERSRKGQKGKVKEKSGQGQSTVKGRLRHVQGNVKARYKTEVKVRSTQGQGRVKAEPNLENDRKVC